MHRVFVALFLGAMSVWAGSDHCPVDPHSQFPPEFARSQKNNATEALVSSLGQSGDIRFAQGSNNFIDDFIFGKMAAAGIEPAPLATDAEFLRRLSLDLTGRIPQPEQVEAFLADERAGKRSILIDSLIGSEAFVDNWTFYYANFFEVTGRYYNLIGVPGRNLFNSYLRDFVQRDRSYQEIATELITATGDSYTSGPPNFLIRASQQGDPIQDTWDTLTDRVTTRFLGIKTECISCHDGRRHLEEINTYMAARKRSEFMRMSAFFSRMNMSVMPVDAFNQQNRVIISDRPVGNYHGYVNLNNPGPRPARVGAPYEPVFMLTGEKPRGGNWREEFARMVVSDRQFARAAVNYLWAHFFTVGIVDPPEAWDLGRINPKQPPPAPWALHPTHPELIEALADEFIRSNYSVRRIIRLMVESNAYQLSSRYQGEWKPEFARYFAKHFPRRLLAEEIYDAVITATRTEAPMNVQGYDKPVLYATQLPDPSEPSQDFNVRSFLTNFGRGDWWQLPRTSTTTVIQVLYFMNDSAINNRTFDNRGMNTRVSTLLRSTASDDELVRQLFLATLGRIPNEHEVTTVNAAKTDDREKWMSDLQWVLLNKLDFIFNY